MPGNLASQRIPGSWRLNVHTIRLSTNTNILATA